MPQSSTGVDVDAVCLFSRLGIGGDVNLCCSVLTSEIAAMCLSVCLRSRSSGWNSVPRCHNIYNTLQRLIRPFQRQDSITVNATSSIQNLNPTLAPAPALD